MAPHQLRDDRPIGGDVAADETQRGTLGTVRNASLLLDLLAEGPAWHQLTDLAERSGLALPTVHRLLRSLAAADLVAQDPDSSRYSLGPEVVRLAERYLERLPILAAVGPYLVELRNRTKATVLVATLVGEDVVDIDRVDGDDTGGLFRQGRRTRPARETPAGRLLLGRAGPEVWEALTEPRPARADLETWARATYLVSDPAEAAERCEVAVPLERGRGPSTAALAATGQPPLFTPEVLEAEVVPQLLRAADAVARAVAHA